MKEPKIYQVIPTLNDLSAGPTYSVTNLVKVLEKTMPTEIVTFDVCPTPFSDTLAVKVFNGFYERLGLLGPKAVEYLRALLKADTIVHGHGIWRAAHLTPLLVARSKRHSKVVWSPRGMMSAWSMAHHWNVKKYFWFLLQRPALNRVDCFHVTALIEAEDILRLKFKVPVAIIPNGVDIPAIKDGHVKKKRVVFLSRIHEKKGVHLLISAWREVQSEFPDWSLEIAGPLGSDYANRMQVLATELECERVHFSGMALDETKRKLLSESLLFVLPTYSENFGIAIAEALAHGTAILTTTETPWLAAEKKGCGIICDPELSDLKERLRGALALGEEKLQEMGLIGRDWMREEYSWESIAQKFRLLYKWLLEGGRAPDFVINE